MNNELKIGQNIIIKCCKTHIAIGSPTEIKLVIIYSILMSLSFALWIGFLYSFLHLSLIIICAIVFFITIANYLLCFFKEPGIIPRNSAAFAVPNKDTASKKEDMQNNPLVVVLDVENIHVIHKEANTSGSDQDLHFQLKEKESVKKVFNLLPELEEGQQSNNIKVIDIVLEKKDSPNKTFIFNQTEKVEISEIPSIFTNRNCETCKISRPSKASHCRICDNCVESFDQ